MGSPVVDDQERAYVATSDGYLHAFERDGRFRWSYTVQGTPLGSVSLRPSDGVILLGTSARFVYALNQSGSLHWVFRSLSPVWSGLFALNSETVVFVGQDRRLYAVANRTGRARYRVRAPGIPMADPVVDDQQIVWVPLADGVARFQAAYRLSKFDLPSSAEFITPVGSGVVALAGDHAYAIVSGRDPQLVGPAKYVAGDGERFVLVTHDGGARLYDSTFNPSGNSFTLQATVGPRKGVFVSAPPALVDQVLWVPYSDGSLGLYRLLTHRVNYIIVGSAPLSTPVVGKSRTWALSTSWDGQFCAVQSLDEG